MHGILNCYKPAGMSSRDVVDTVLRRVRPNKVGHAGTLDPLAEGVLVIGIGAACRLVPYLHLYPKTYAAMFRLGWESLSGDLEGEVVQHPDLPPPTLEQLRSAARALTGRIQQVPPLYSAVQVKGRRAYAAARAAQPFEMPPRTVHVHRFDVTDYDFPLLAAEIHCGTGTYIRTLGIDLASRCGSTAVMSGLVRTSVGPFRAAEAVRISDVTDQAIDLASFLHPLRDGAGMLGNVVLEDDELVEIGHGRPIRPGWTPDGVSPRNEWAGLDQRGQLRAILVERDGRWGPKRVFPLADEPGRPSGRISGEPAGRSADELDGN